jgi:hypothetical protein
VVAAAVCQARPGRHNVGMTGMACAPIWAGRPAVLP